MIKRKIYAVGSINRYQIGIPSDSVIVIFICSNYASCERNNTQLTEIITIHCGSITETQSQLQHCFPISNSIMLDIYVGHFFKLN